MAFDAHKNLAYSLVATAPSPASSGTSLVVTAGQGALFPTPPFNATVWATNANPLTTNAEIVRVTGISTDTLTIVRAQESTSARSIVIGDQIAATMTVKTFTDIESSPVFTGIVTAPSINLGYQAVATAGSTTTLTNASPYFTQFTGSTTQTLVLPDATTLSVGQCYLVDNDSTGIVTINANGGGLIWTLAPNTCIILVLTVNSPAAGTWDTSQYNGTVYVNGKVLTVNNSLTLAGTDATVMTFPSYSTSIADYSFATVLFNQVFS